MKEAIKSSLSIGQKIERVRTFKGVKQQYLASKLGVSQQTVSKVEQQEEIEQDQLKRIADVLGVSPEVIRNFDDDKITYAINHQYAIYNNEIKGARDRSFSNPVEKIAQFHEWLSAIEKDKRFV